MAHAWPLAAESEARAPARAAQTKLLGRASYSSFVFSIGGILWSRMNCSVAISNRTYLYSYETRFFASTNKVYYFALIATSSEPAISGFVTGRSF